MAASTWPLPATSTTVRPAGDVLVIAPPYIVETSHIDQLVNTLADSIRRHA